MILAKISGGLIFTTGSHSLLFVPEPTFAKDGECVAADMPGQLFVNVDFLDNRSVKEFVEGLRNGKEVVILDAESFTKRFSVQIN